MTYCEECLHYEVCCDEGKDDEACVYCKNRMVSRTGHWINNHNGTFECDKCGCKYSKSKWCPNCGAKMEVKEQWLNIMWEVDGQEYMQAY